jgi:RNA recognition motif-containing protein
LSGVRVRVLAFKDRTDKKSHHDTQQLFVKGLPKAWTHEELYQAFTGFGKVLSAKVSINAEFTSRGFGFVEMEDEQATQLALKSMNDKTVDDCILSVSEYVPWNDRHGMGRALCSNNLYVKDFPQLEFTED